MEEKIIEVYLQNNRKNYGIEELAGKLNCSKEEIENALKQLSLQKKVYKSGKNKYHINVYFLDDSKEEQMKNTILKALKENKMLTFRHLAIAINCFKKDRMIYLRHILQNMEKKQEIYHSNARGFYALEKIDYQNETELKNHILRIIAKIPQITYKRLKKELHFCQEDNEELLKEILQKLEENGTILYRENQYQKMPSNFFRASILNLGGGYLTAKIPRTNEICKIPLEHSQGAMKFDEVVISLANEDKINKIEKVTKRFNPYIVCEVVLADNVPVLKPYHTLTKVKPRISSKDMKKLVPGDLVLVNLSDEQNGEFYEANLERLIGNVNDPDIDLKCIALNYGFSETFSEEAIKEANSIPTEVTEAEMQGRVNLRDKTIITMDGEDCKDMDDAISLEKTPEGYFKLGVHIADVTHYIKPDSALDKEAKMRGTSLYMINSSLPMIPRILTNGILSLNPGVDRLAMTCEMLISPTGKVVDYKIYESVIHSKKKMSYKEVNKVLDGTPSKDYEPFKKTLLEMQQLSLILTANAKKRGYLDFASVEPKYNVDENGKIISIEPYSQLAAQKIIENFMVITNETIDTHLFWLGFPKLSRTHVEPDEARLKQTIDILKQAGYKIKTSKEKALAEQLPEILQSLRVYEQFPILSDMILRCMARASYTTTNIGHFGLHLEHYMHFTSPIRRYPDLETHRLLKLYQSKELGDVNLEVLESELKVDAEYASNRERMADQAEMEAQHLKNVLFYEEKIGEEVVGYIVGFSYKKIMVETKDLVRGTVVIEDIETSDLGKHGNRSLDYRIAQDHLKIGSKVLLGVKEVDKDEKIVHFTLKKNLSWKNDKGMTRVLKIN